MSNCLTVQHRVDYYCSLRTSKDTHTLLEQLQNPRSQDIAETVHILLHNPRSLADRPAFFQLMAMIGQLPHLREVSISTLQCKKLPASAVALLLRNAKNLRVLNLEDISLQESPYELAEVLKAHPTLHTIQMLRCYCSPVHVLVQAMSKMPHLQSLSMDGSILAHQKDADALAALASICLSPSLHSLHLTEIDENNMTQPLIAVINGLHQQPHAKVPISGLTELSLHVAAHEAMPLTVVRALARVLLTNTSLRTLIVPWTGGGEAWLPVVEALAFNSTLQQIRLHPISSIPSRDFHNLSPQFLQRVAGILRDRNTRLNYLWYDDWENIDLEIDLYLRSNRLGRGHLLHDERPNHDEWVGAVVSSRDHAHVSYYWLSQNPSLLVSAIAKSA